MRIAPTSVEFSNLALGDGVGALAAVTTCVIESATATTSGVLLGAAVASGLTQYRPYYCIANNSTSAYIALSAEL